MDEGFKTWDEPATRGDVIKVAVRVMSICQALGAVHSRILAGETEDAYTKMGDFFDKMKAMSDTIDEIAGRVEG